MTIETPSSGPAGTTDQSPRWEGPTETRPLRHLPAEDDPDENRDAVGETNENPERNKTLYAFKTGR